MKNFLPVTLIMLTVSSYAQGIKKNDRVLYVDEYSGKVTEVGKEVIFVKLDGLHTTAADLSDVTKFTKQKGRFHIRNRILLNSSYPGTIIELFENGSARITLDGLSGSRIENISNLSKGFDCIESVCVDSRIPESNLPGTLVEIFDNGQAKVQYEGIPDYSIVSLKELGYAVNCSDLKPCKGIKYP